MTEDQQESATPKLATSDPISLAVAFLISLVIRWACFALALPIGLLAIVALMAMENKNKFELHGNNKLDADGVRLKGG
jgi:hypothetical protein